MPRNAKGFEVAEIIPDSCIGCQICLSECPVGAIRLSAEGVAVIDPEACIGCGKCSEVCPVGAVRSEKKRRQKVTQERKEDFTGGRLITKVWPSSSKLRTAGEPQYPGS